jgi:hypothetical protein
VVAFGTAVVSDCMPISHPLGTIIARPTRSPHCGEVTIRNPQPITAAKAIWRGLVFEYVTGKISTADE